MTDISFYCAFYIDDVRAINHKGNSNNLVEVYLDCFMRLSNDFLLFGRRIKLLTNRNSEIEAYIKKKAPKVFDYEVIDFDEVYPKGIRFYGAHYKLECYKYLSNVVNDFVCLLDLDVTISCDMVKYFGGLDFRSDTVYIYDVGMQFTKDALDRHHMDLDGLTKINSGSKAIKWTGGEFILASPAYIKELYLNIVKLRGEYLNSLDNLQHVGDETLLNAALIKSGVKYVDINIFTGHNIIIRFWSCYTEFNQNSLRSAFKYKIMHLPSDKNVLSKLCNAGRWRFNILCFVLLSKNLLVRRLMRPLTGRGRYVASLW